MRKSTKNASLHEALRNLWKIRIMLEKNYTETCATWMAQRIESLIDHMQYGHALIAYHKQDGTFRLAKATLLPYKADFRKDYDDVRKKISFFFTAFFHDSSYGAKGKKRFFTDDFTAWKSSACVVRITW